MFKKLERSQGFHPRRLAPPNAMSSEQVLRHHRYLSAGAVRGDRHCPLIQLTCAFIFISLEELDERPAVIHHVCMSL